MKNKKRGLIYAVAVSGSLLFYGVTASATNPVVLATPGYHILNMTSTDYKTTDPAGCTGVVFPGVSPGGDKNPKSSNEIKVTPDINATCTTTYTNKDNISCIVTFDPSSGVLKLSANPADPNMAPNACHVENDNTIVLTGVKNQKK